MERNEGRIALVTGGNRGLGLETCRQMAGLGYSVVLSARDESAAADAAAQLGVSHTELDVTDPASIDRAVSTLREGYGRVDVLVNNAGVLARLPDTDSARRTIAVNFRGALSVTDAFRPILAEDASVVMVSSGLGELSCLSGPLRKRFADPNLSREGLSDLIDQFLDDVEDGRFRDRGWPASAYSVSKAGLNALTRVLARELTETRIRVNSVCPGWVRTDMGGPGASRDVVQGAESIVWAATLGEDGPTGGFFRDGREIPW